MTALGRDHNRNFCAAEVARSANTSAFTLFSAGARESSKWRPVLTGRRSGALGAEQTRDELTNLIRLRLEKTLGYGFTHTPGGSSHCQQRHATTRSVQEQDSTPSVLLVEPTQDVAAVGSAAALASSQAPSRSKLACAVAYSCWAASV